MTLKKDDQDPAVIKKEGNKFIWSIIFIFVVVLFATIVSFEIKTAYDEGTELIIKTGTIIDIDIEAKNENVNNLYVYFDDGDYIIIEQDIRNTYALILPFKNKEVIFEYIKTISFFNNEFVSIKEKEI